MPLAQYTRDSKYFADLRDINAVDFDNQFNELVIYLNNQFATYINNIAVGAAVGSMDSPGALVRNVGDGTTLISYARGEDLLDYSLEFRKFAKATSITSIVASNSDGNFQEVFYPADALDENIILFSNLGNLPTWRRIVSDDIEEASITGNEIGIETIQQEHLQPGVTVSNVKDNELLGRNFSNLSISTRKYLPFSFEYRNLGVLINVLPQNPTVRVSSISTDSLDYEKVQGASLRLNSFHRFHGTNQELNLPFDAIAEQTIDNSFFNDTVSFQRLMLEDVTIEGENNFLTSRELTPGSLDKTMFEPAVQAAFTAKGL